jgi:hypothetical protein
MVKLSILICSIKSRANQLNEVLRLLGTHLEVEILIDVDNKEVSVGVKRQRLLEKSVGKWIVYFDDDDEPYYGYIDKILYGIDNYPDIDCMGIYGDMTTNGINPKTWIHSMQFKEWRGDGKKKLDSGFDYERNIIHFNPVLRSKAIQVGFNDIRFGEDKDYAMRLYPLLSKEYLIATPLFHYKFTTSNNHNDKYGIK